MTLQELLKKYLEDDAKVQKVMEEMKENKIFVASEENLDVRYKKLQEDHNTKDQELTKAQKLIDELKASAESNPETKKKFDDYEIEIAKLQQENKNLKIESELKLALQGAKATNVDYIAYQIDKRLKAEGKALELDENNHIKGIDGIIEEQKKSEPSFFASEVKKEVNVKDLGKSNEDSGQPEPTDLLSALKQHYSPKTDI